MPQGLWRDGPSPHQRDAMGHQQRREGPGWEREGRQTRQKDRRLGRGLHPTVPMPVLQGDMTTYHHGAVGASGHCTGLPSLVRGHQLLRTAALGPVYPLTHPPFYILKQFKAFCGEGARGISYLIEAIADFKASSSEGKLKTN